MNQLMIGSDGTLIVKCTFQDKEIPKSLGGKWNNADKTWLLPFTVYNVENLTKRFQNLEVSPQMQELLEDQRNKEKKLDQIKTRSKVNASIKFRVPGVNVSLYNFQKFGVMFAITNNDGVLIGDQMGLGKTIQSIATCCFKKYNRGANECLIITPASLKWNWPLEIEKFTDESYVVIDGPPKEREKQWLGECICKRNDDGSIEYTPIKKDGPLFYIVNFELITEDLFGGRKITIKEDDSEDSIARKTKMIEKATDRAKRLKNIRQRLWDVICIDEIQAIKRHGSGRSKNIKSLKGRFKMGLSGTPIDGKLEELHSVMQFIRPCLFEAKFNFLRKHAEFDFWGNVIKYKNIEEVKERIKPFFIRRLKSEVLKDLPEKIYENRYVNLSKEEMKIYRDLAKGGHEATENEEAIVAVIRCKQFCDYPNLIGVETKHNSKMEEFLSVVDEIVIQNGCKTLVFSQYAKMNEIIMDEMRNLGIKYEYIWSKTPKDKRVKLQKIFDEDASLDMIIGTDAMSLGLNFTAADHVINYDDFWSPSVMAQREDRCHRMGQKNTVTVVNFVCKNTIEERIRNVLYSKSAVSAEVLGDDTDEVVLRRLGPKEMAKLL